MIGDFFRPPPKNVRRVEPPTIPSQQQQLSSSPKRDTPFAGSTMPLPSSSGGSLSSDSPGNSLERNIKPSDILRQKSSENLDSKYAANRKTTPELGKFVNVNNPELMEELGRKMVGKADGLEQAKRSDSSVSPSSGSGGGSLGRTASTPGRALTPGRTGAGVGASPTGSLNKSAKLAAADSSSTSSLEKKSRTSLQASDAEANQRSAGSKESLASQGISEVVGVSLFSLFIRKSNPETHLQIKSYESVSSLSSESAKAAAAAASSSQQNAAASSADNEPYYDSVPLDNGEGEYVFIKPGRTGSSSSRDDLSTPGSSTLPLASVADPESPGRTSNYVNIDYFLQYVCTVWLGHLRIIVNLFMLTTFRCSGRQSNETRSSSLDSDGEYEGPPILRTISHDEQTTTTGTTTNTTTTSQTTPGALRKVSGSLLISICNYNSPFPVPHSQSQPEFINVVVCRPRPHFPPPIWGLR